MNDKSQAGQSRFVAHVLEYKRNGSFLDVGASEPVNISNTYSLEQDLDWRGVLLDISPESIAQCASQRKSKAVEADATKFDFRPILRGMPVIVDYLSFDVDEAQVPALENFLHACDETNARFRVLTVETDRYRFGDKPRERIIQLLGERGYALLADDVMSQGCPFETWWVYPSLVDLDRAKLFRSTGLDWQEVLRKGGAL